MESILQNKRIVLGVTGGIAVYKAVELLRRFTAAGANVRVAMTTAAQAFVAPLTFEALSGQRIYSDVLALETDPDRSGAAVRIEHVTLAAEADLVVVAPATADFLARTALGRANDALGALLLATRAPLVIAPAMEHHMWTHSATQGHIRTLLERGCHIVEPGEGLLASGALGKGRLAELEQIVAAAEAVLGKAAGDLQGRRLVVTAGPTREAIDPVRYISNRSSGRMGSIIAEAAALRGAEVTFVHGPLTANPPLMCKRIAVESAADMLEQTVAASADAHAVVMAAAVADYTPSQVSGKKLKKTEQQLQQIELTETVDILKTLCENKGDRVVVGFAAETQDVVQNARAKIKRKGADLLLANLVGSDTSGFDVATSEATLLSADGSENRLGLVDKTVVARAILDAVRDLLSR